MTAFIENTTKCEICEKKMKRASGFEEWAIVERYRILSLCKDCSTMVNEFIEFLKREGRWGTKYEYKNKKK